MYCIIDYLLTYCVFAENLVDPVEKTDIDKTSEGFKKLNSSLHEYKSEIKDPCKFSEIVSEINAADKKINVCYEKTFGYLTRIKSEFLKSRIEYKPYYHHSSLNQNKP